MLSDLYKLVVPVATKTLHEQRDVRLRELPHDLDMIHHLLPPIVYLFGFSLKPVLSRMHHGIYFEVKLILDSLTLLLPLYWIN